MTSAPKSDRITAALGPAMKLAKSTTLSPEKILSFVMAVLSESSGAAGFFSPPVELRRALFEEGGRALLLVLGCSAEAEVGSLEQQAFALARFHDLVCSFERVL